MFSFRLWLTQQQMCDIISVTTAAATATTNHYLCTPHFVSVNCLTHTSSLELTSEFMSNYRSASIVVAATAVIINTCEGLTAAGYRL